MPSLRLKASNFHFLHLGLSILIENLCTFFTFTSVFSWMNKLQKLIYNLCLQLLPITDVLMFNTDILFQEKIQEWTEKEEEKYVAALAEKERLAAMSPATAAAEIAAAAAQEEGSAGAKGGAGGKRSRSQSPKGGAGRKGSGMRVLKN